MKLILLGPPGSGKGTVSECLTKTFKLQHISPGELLREEVRKATPIGKEVQKYIEKGDLVPNKFVVEMVKLEVLGKNNFILDGFPRTLDQARSIEELHIDKVLMLEVSEKAIVERLSGRRLCSKCGAGFHIKYIPPKKKGICDKCASKLVQRKDDQPKVIKERFKVYHKETRPLAEYYSKKKLLWKVDASGKPEEVCQLATAAVKF